MRRVRRVRKWRMLELKANRGGHCFLLFSLVVGVCCFQIGVGLVGRGGAGRNFWSGRHEFKCM